MQSNGKLHKSQVRLVIVGDGASGKTTLLHAFNRGHFNQNYEPTVFATSEGTLRLDGREVSLRMTDTAGQEDFDQLRTLGYYNADVVLVAFNVDSRVAFESVRAKWAGDVHAHCPGARIVLVGLKTDLREDRECVERLLRVGMAPVSASEGRELATFIGAHAYVECSSLRNHNVDQVFLQAARVALRLPEPSPDMPNGRDLNGPRHPVVGKIVQFCKKLNCRDKSHFD